MIERPIRTPAELHAAGLARDQTIGDLERVAARYAVSLTSVMAGLIDPEDPDDPIGRQFLPTQDELLAAPEESADPTGDGIHSPVKGVVHRYPDRALLKLTHTCPVYCRFCFRRESVGPQGAGGLNPEELAAAFAYIRSRPEIWEVILTGGDPLMLSSRRLAGVVAELGRIDQVKVVRLHTRVPVADPPAITPALVEALKGRAAVYVALHANHPRELTAEARAACARLVDAGVAMVSQTVLLRGVNDTPEILGALMRAFVETRIKPYYLHQGDLAPGTGPFRTSLETGRDLMKSLRGDYSGLCQPTYVLDIPGGYGKVPVGPAYLHSEGPAGIEIEDPWGAKHRLPPSGPGPRTPAPARA